MRKILKISLILILTLSMLITMLPNYSEASGYSEHMKELINADYSDSSGASNKISNISTTIITAIRIAGVAVAIVILLVLAMKYMMAAPGDKADIKKSAIYYVIGAVVLFAGTQLLGIINQFSKAIE